MASDIAEITELKTGRADRSGLHWDLVAVASALVLVAAANLVITWGHWYTFKKIFAYAPPLFGDWHPHLGPGTLLTITLAIVTITRGPELTAQLRWPALACLSYLGAVAWTLSAALIDGWQRGLPSRLTTPDEYLAEVPGITNISRFLNTFTTRILFGHPNSWTAHVAGHPPAATLLFVWLDRIGLGGGGPAALACVLVGGLTAVAVPATIRALGNETAARATVPFLVLLPGAGIAGISADWLFAGVSSTGIALLAIGAVGLRSARPRWPASSVLAALAAGLLLGFSIFLSYGLVLIGLVALAVVAVSRGMRAVLPAAVAAVAVVAGFAAAGFYWLDGYHLLIQRYFQDLGRTRPYDYWVWANLACLVLTAGPVLAVGLRRGATRLPAMVRNRGLDSDIAVIAVVAAAALAITIADWSGLSKAETERIWLPFAVWLIASTSLLPTNHRRWWLILQVITVLVIKHLVWTQW